MLSNTSSYPNDSLHSSNNVTSANKVITDPLPPPYIPSGITNIWSLPETALRKLIERQGDKTDDQFVLTSRKIYYYVLFSFAAAVWAVLLGWLSEKFVWSFMHQILFGAGSLFACSISAIYLAKVIYWFWRPLKPGIIVTPLHLIQIDETGVIKYKSLELLQTVVIRNTKSMGVFRGASVLLDFVGSTTYLSLEKASDASSLEVAVSVYRTNLKNATLQKLHNLTRKFNDFESVGEAVQFDAKAQKRGVPSLAGALTIGLLFGIGVYVTGDYLNGEYRIRLDNERKFALAKAEQEAALKIQRPPLTRPEPLKEVKKQIPVTPQSRPDPYYTAPTSGLIESKGELGKIPIKFVAEGGGIHYFVKIRNATTNELVHSVIVRSGQTLRVHLGAGQYSFEYAAGTTWSDKTKSFGDNEIKYADPKSYELKTEPGRPIFGKTLEMKTTTDKKHIQVIAYDLALS
ncbi:MAG: hypothetical protein OEM52_10050 [bacterium]|nr:hypothetical protein [bacterium]